MSTICKVNGFELNGVNGFYSLVMPSGSTMVNASGSKDELISELNRWKEEVDFNNEFMLEVENKFIDELNKQPYTFVREFVHEESPLEDLRECEWQYNNGMWC
ncbi:MAG: hypothetical protein K0S18_133 [Anaerocolumna sp.]|jgi:hypothetical protein|nr:hypothetical protein [Anaerocolumna sp.]